MNIHPGVIAALRRLAVTDELGVARLMAEGELSSPQRWHNVTLINLRITGTGIAHRPSLNEYVYRKPENYLTPDFLARCNGLSVIWEHPKKSLLTSKEYAARNIGAVMLPYIKGDEVWAISRVYDDEAIQLLADDQLSTSPAVLLDKSTKLQLEDGSNLLIEGKVSLLDHIAVCENGVWDKGEGPTGIETNIRGDSIAMTDKEEAERKDAEEKARKDAEEKERHDAAKRMDEKLDLMLKGIDACTKRMDAWEEEEKKKADAAKADAAKKDGEGGTEAERLAADKKKADAEKEEKERKDAEEAERKKADAARADSTTIKEMAEQIKNLTALVRQPIADSDRTALSEVQARADDVFIQLGDRAPQPLVGESPMMYRRRIVGLLSKHSDRWKGKPLERIDDVLLDNIEKDIYADALVRARSPNDMKPGQIRERKWQENGHTYTEFTGGPDAHFIKSLTRPARRVRSFRPGAAA